MSYFLYFALFSILLSGWTYAAHVGDECHCSASGDPHYHTFDGMNYDFMGKCAYIMAESVDQGLECSFTVKAFNDHRHESFSFVHSAEIAFMDQVFNFDPGNVLKVNNQEIRSKSVIEGDNLQVMLNGGWLILNSPKCGLRVELEGSHLVLKLKRNQYGGKVRGLCGNCNGNNGDEFTDKNGGAANNAVQFANSFVTHSQYSQGRAECVIEKVPPIQPHPCRGEWETRSRQLRHCGAFLLESNGPFSRCIQQDRARAERLFKACTYDVCMNKNDAAEINKISCGALKAFQVSCSEAGIDNIDWRKSCGCEIKCQGHQVYQTKLDPCPASCDRKREKVKCPADQKPREGCGCDNGFILFGAECITPDKCPPTKEVSLSFKRLKSTKVEQNHNIDKAFDTTENEEATFGDDGNPLTMKRGKTNKGHHKENRTNKQENIDLTEGSFDGNGDFFKGATDFMGNFDTGRPKGRGCKTCDE